MSSHGSAAGGPERRAFPRRALSLRGELDLDGRQRAPVRFIDFCEGGLFLQLEGEQGDFLVLDGRQVVADMRVWVSFAAGGTNEGQTLRVAARIARILDGGIGVAFDPPDITAIVTLQRLVEVPAEPATSPDAGKLKIMDGLHERLSSWVKSTLATAYKATCDELFVMARDATNNEQQNEYMDAMKDVERVSDKASRDCRLALLRLLERLGGKSDETDGGEQERELGMDSGALTLVDTGSFDDWVTAKNIMSRAEPRLRDPIYELSRRLSELSGRKVDDFTNPAGLQQIGMAFNESLQNLGLSKRARTAIYKSFDEIIVASLDRLYELLNGFLVEEGVLPNVERPKASVPHREHAPAPDTAGEEEPEQEQEPYEEADTGPHPAPHGPRPAPPRGAAAAPPRAAAAAPPGTAGAAAPAPAAAGSDWAAYHDAPAAPDVGSAPAPDPAQGPPGIAGGAPPAAAPMPDPLAQAQTRGPAAPAPPGAVYHPPPPGPAVAPVPMGQAYQAARNLMGLRRAMGHAQSQSAPASAGAEVPGVGQDFGMPEPPSPRLQQALNHAQRSEDFNRPRGSQPLRLNERLMSSLAREGIALNDAQQEAMEVLSTLVEALLGDPMITNAVKPRIKRLAVPMLKVAMKDQEFFADDNHPARQMVNRLGQLDLPEALAPGVSGDSLASNVDPLVDRIVGDDEMTSEGFVQALPELDGLLTRQNERFTRAVSELVGTPEHARALASAPELATSVPTRAQPWLARAGHLRAGDVMSFARPGQPPDARTLAWVSDDHSLFVFTDRDGSNGLSMNRAELAQSMARGEASMLDAPDASPMDRGMVSMLDQMHEAVSQERERDSVTGLMSLAQFRGLLDEAIESARQVGAKHALLAMNVDGFAGVNEQGGRRAGNSLLRKLARLFGGQVGKQGALTRVYADEFLLLLADSAFMDAKRFAERQCRAVANARVAFKGEQLSVTLSVGMVPVTRASPDSDGVIHNARAALITARAQGNRVRVYDPEQDRLQAPERGEPTLDDDLLVLEPADEGASPEDTVVATSKVPSKTPAAVAGGSRILELMESDGLVLTRQLVQPLAGQDDRPHYEILLGMLGDGDELQSLPPDLIGDAEQGNQMAQVDRWVIRNTLSWMQRNRREVLRSGCYAINLSGNTLSDEALLEFVMGELTRSAVPPAKVIFEVTESVAIDRLSNAVEFIRTMREYGCRFSIDDFGAGHATFTYLKTLPVDFVKIDGLFVREMHKEPNDLAMVKSIHEISHLLGKKTVAEHVEHDAALAMLKEMGVDYAQGYAVARPERLP